MQQVQVVSVVAVSVGRDDRGGRAGVEILDGGAVVFRRVDAVGREKFLHREPYPGEERAGVVLRAGHAVLVGQAVVVHRHDELAVPLQADDGELSQCGKPYAAAVRQHQVLAEVGQDGGGDSGDVRHQAGGAGVRHLHVQSDGVHALHHADGLGIAVGKGAVGAEHLGGTLAAKEDDPLVEYAQAVHRVLAGEGGAGDLVEIGHVHGVVAPVEADLVNVHIRKQQSDPRGPHAERALYVWLGRVA